jgi:uncharacterized protein
LAGERVWLMGEKALYWPGASTLFVADVHLGKAATFRRAGIAIPPGSNRESLDRLSQALESTKAERLVILGDLLHSATARNPDTMASLSAFRARHRQVTMQLIRGNHDDRSGDPPTELSIECLDPPHCQGPFALCHEPTAVANGYVLAGHVHPGLRLKGGVDSARVACFWLGERCAVLPAFGAFTGTWIVTPQAGDRLYPVAEGQVFAGVGR